MATRALNGEPWPNCIYEKIPCTNNIRVWWDTDDQTSKWTDKWYLTPISRDEINKGYGLNQNPVGNPDFKHQ